MALIRMLVLLVVFGGGTVFVLQNFSPALPLVVFGSQTLTLPVGLWLLLFLLAGALTGLFLQIINYSPRPSPKDYRERKVTVSPPPPPQSGNYKRERQREAETTSNASSYPSVEPDQTITSPPINNQPETKQDKEDVELKFPSNNSFDSVDVPPQDKTNSPKVDKIHDANYRVIEPPTSPNGEVGKDDDDEEWI